jgi:hypothetical protein
MMASMDDDKLVKYQSQRKQRKVCRAVFLLAFTLAASVITFSFSPSTSQLVTTASKYHPQVKDIHRRLNTAAHRHLNKAHVHLKNHHWSASTATKLRGNNAASFVHLHQVNHDGRTLGEQEEKPMAQAQKKVVASDMNEQQDVVTNEHADTAAATNQPQESIASKE